MELLHLPSTLGDCNIIEWQENCKWVTERPSSTTTKEYTSTPSHAENCVSQAKCILLCILVRIAHGCLGESRSMRFWKFWTVPSFFGRGRSGPPFADSLPLALPDAPLGLPRPLPPVHPSWGQCIFGILPWKYHYSCISLHHIISYNLGRKTRHATR